MKITEARWEKLNLSSKLGNDPIIHDIYFTDSEHGWIFGGTGQLSSKILKTTNGGDTWSVMFSEDFSMPIMKLYFTCKYCTCRSN